MPKKYNVKRDHVCRPDRTLHKAIRLVLEECKDNRASTKHICEEIIQRGLYKQRKGGDVFPDQIFLRARKYLDWFEVIDRSTISLLKKLLALTI
jgi:hypothetical protein